MDCEQRAEHSDQVLPSLSHIHGLGEAAESDIEEFLDDLIAYDSLAGVDRLVE